MNTDIVPIEIKEIVLSVQQKANSLVVESPEQATEASEVLHEIKDATRRLTEQKEFLTRPAMQTLASIKALFAPRETALKDADKTVRAKMIAYQIEEAERVEQAKAKIVARAEKGTIKQETAVKKLGEVKEVSKTEGIRVQTRRKLEIVDETLIPREYLVLDREAITKALFAGIVVAGAELREEKILNVV
jgi:actin-related protein